MINDSQTVGQAVLRMRQRAKMTAEDLAQKMRNRGFRWNAVTVSKIENGDRQLKLTEAAIMLECMGRSIDDLANLAGDRIDLDLVYGADALEDKVDGIYHAIKSIVDKRENLRLTVSRAEREKRGTEGAIRRAKQALEKSSDEEILDQVEGTLDGRIVEI